jgi:heme-degrading monooxygenase HmoA
MILRVFRARVQIGKQAEFEIKVGQHSIPMARKQRGLVHLFAGRPMASSPDEFAIITIWRSLDDLKAFVGVNWNQSLIPEAERPLLESTFVHHYEVFDGDEG